MPLKRLRNGQTGYCDTNDILLHAERTVRYIIYIPPEGVDVSSWGWLSTMANFPLKLLNTSSGVSRIDETGGLYCIFPDFSKTELIRMRMAGRIILENVAILSRSEIVIRIFTSATNFCNTSRELSLVCGPNGTTWSGKPLPTCSVLTKPHRTFITSALQCLYICTLDDKSV